ncbi:hypothetical protein [Bordetella bronchiseptica]|uniref:hypothetical protein n=1 Tax=Bordetella bronchiseptica TaxID=518 RepID=UPI00128FBA2A|nr:hypothetical protein [Bordetella bronchiseptica]
MSAKSKVNSDLNSAIGYAKHAAQLLSNTDHQAADSLLRAFAHLHDAVAKLARDMDSRLGE